MSSDFQTSTYPEEPKFCRYFEFCGPEFESWPSEKYETEAPSHSYPLSPGEDSLKMEEKNNVEKLDTSEEKAGENVTSATTKALNRIEIAEESKKPRWSKKGKIPSKLRREKLNGRLAKLLTPKSALNLLHEIRPGCMYITKESPSQNSIICTGFTVQVKQGKDILGIGQGLTKSQAKNSAAENAIKNLFSRAVRNVADDNQVEEEENKIDIPWAGLAQFAMYKMFNEWQHQNPELPMSDIPKLLTLAKTSGVTQSAAHSKKEVPPDAHNFHPATVLNNIHPGLTCIELERTTGPPSRVKVAYELDGRQYCGVSTNRKEAKKEAAKVLLSTVYGVNYEL